MGLSVLMVFGKSTFLKILSGEIDSQTGHVSMGKDERLAAFETRSLRL